MNKQEVTSNEAKFPATHTTPQLCPLQNKSVTLPLLRITLDYYSALLLLLLSISFDFCVICCEASFITMENISIREGGLDNPLVIQLLETHLTHCRAETGEGSAHALDISGLKTPDIKFWTVWDQENNLIGMGAIKMFEPKHFEVKSMHTVAATRGKGVASRLLTFIIEESRKLGAERLSLETGSWPYFVPARELYKKHGFTETGPYGSYKLDPNSVFMTLSLI